MNTKQTFAAALIAAGLLAAPAYAQDQIVDSVKDEVASEMTDIAKEKAKSEMKDHGGKMMKGDLTIEADQMMEAKDGTVTASGDPLTIETPENILVVKDGTMTSGQDGIMIEGDDITTHSAPMMDAPTEITTVNIACPEGTTAQPDGTCMITGDYQE